VAITYGGELEVQLENMTPLGLSLLFSVVLLANERYLDQLLKKMRANLRAGRIARTDLLKVQVPRNQVRPHKIKVANTFQVALLDFGLPSATLTHWALR
jgi:hypothetical protein